MIYYTIIYKFYKLQSLQIVTPQIVTYTQIVTPFLALRNICVTFWVSGGYQKNKKLDFFSRRANFFFVIIFSQINFVNYESSFLNQKITFRIINKNGILILESIHLMRNPQGTQIGT